MIFVGVQKCFNTICSRQICCPKFTISLFKCNEFHARRSSDDVVNIFIVDYDVTGVNIVENSFQRCTIDPFEWNFTLSSFSEIRSKKRIEIFTRCYQNEAMSWNSKIRKMKKAKNMSMQSKGRINQMAVNNVTHLCLSTPATRITSWYSLLFATLFIKVLANSSEVDILDEKFLFIVRHSLFGSTMAKLVWWCLFLYATCVFRRHFCYML